jgi:hypothetical protein
MHVGLALRTGRPMGGVCQLFWLRLLTVLKDILMSMTGML